MAGIRGKQFQEDTMDPTQTLRIFTDGGGSEAFTNAVVDSIFASGAVTNAKLVFESDQSIGSNKLTSVAPGTAGTDAVNKNQLTAPSVVLMQ